MVISGSGKLSDSQGTLPEPKTNDLRNTWIDAIRGIGALGVTIFHLNEPIAVEVNWYRETVKHAWPGVIVFFVVS